MENDRVVDIDEEPMDGGAEDMESSEAGEEMLEFGGDTAMDRALAFDGDSSSAAGVDLEAGDLASSDRAFDVAAAAAGSDLASGSSDSQPGVPAGADGWSLTNPLGLRETMENAGKEQSGHKSDSNALKSPRTHKGGEVMEVRGSLTTTQTGWLGSSQKTEQVSGTTKLPGGPQDNVMVWEEKVKGSDGKETINTLARNDSLPDKPVYDLKAEQNASGSRNFSWVPRKSK